MVLVDVDDTVIEFFSPDKHGVGICYNKIRGLNALVATASTAGVGKTKATLRTFFDALESSEAGRCARITHVIADGADWIGDVVAEYCPKAIRAADPFHVVAWATDALDEVRREAWNDARKLARTEPKRSRGRPPKDTPPRPATQRAKALKGARYALWKNPDNLSDNQQAKLAWIAKTDPKLHRAYLLKEGLRDTFRWTWPTPPEP